MAEIADDLFDTSNVLKLKELTQPVKSHNFMIVTLQLTTTCYSLVFAFYDHITVTLNSLLGFILIGSIPWMILMKNRSIVTEYSGKK